MYVSHSQKGYLAPQVKNQCPIEECSPATMQSRHS